MSDTLIIIIAVIAVLVVGFVVFRSVSSKQTGQLPGQSSTDDEGDSMADGFADATEELLGDFVGVETHPVSPEAVSEAARLNATKASEEAAADAGPRDELGQIKGLGPKAEGSLNGMGITRFAQIAAWTQADIADVAARLGRAELADRIARDQWVEQAGLLARGDRDTFEEKFGKIG